MNDARQGPIPQDRVNENVDRPPMAGESNDEQRTTTEPDLEREAQEGEDLSGTDPQQQPGIPDGPQGPAEGGD